MSCQIDQQKLDRIKDIERKAYPKFMYAYQDVETPEQAYDEIECNGDYFCHVDNGWYMLGCNDSEVYVEDLASIRPLGFTELNVILNILRQFGDKFITADCRFSTSYRLLKLAERKKLIEIFEEQPWKWGPETMYELKFKVKPIQKLECNTFSEWFYVEEGLNAPYINFF
jgi:hypothetical protein